jgi:hypothetical protein
VREAAAAYDFILLFEETAIHKHKKELYTSPHPYLPHQTEDEGKPSHLLKRMVA